MIIISAQMWNANDSVRTAFDFWIWIKVTEYIASKIYQKKKKYSRKIVSSCFFFLTYVYRNKLEATQAKQSEANGKKVNISKNFYINALKQ